MCRRLCTNTISCNNKIKHVQQMHNSSLLLLTSSSRGSTTAGKFFDTVFCQKSTYNQITNMVINTVPIGLRTYTYICIYVHIYVRTAICFEMLRNSQINWIVANWGTKHIYFDLAKLSLLLFISYAHLLFLVSATRKQHCFCCCKFLAQSERYAAAYCGTIWRRRLTKYASSASFVRGSVCYHFYVVANSTTKFLYVAVTHNNCILGLHFISRSSLVFLFCTHILTIVGHCRLVGAGAVQRA